MNKARNIAGLLAAVMLIASSAAHATLGWKNVHEQLAAAKVPADLVTGLKIGWHFGGAVMLAMGIILLGLFARRMRGEAVTLVPAQIIAILYFVFGVWALVASGYDPFPIVFIVPGVILLFASMGADTIPRHG